MRERRKSKKKKGSGTTMKGKWSYYDAMNFLEYYLQRRTMEVFQREQLQLKFHSLIQMKLKWAILNNWKENIIHDKKMEGGLSKKAASRN